MTKELDKEELVGQLLCGWVAPIGIDKIAASMPKRQALERYMRTFLRALTLPELEFELKHVESNKKLSPELEYRLMKANRGYDVYTGIRAKSEPALSLADYKAVA